MDYLAIMCQNAAQLRTHYECRYEQIFCDMIKARGSQKCLK